MKDTEERERETVVTLDVEPADVLRPLLNRPATSPEQLRGVVVGDLLGVREDTRIALVSFAQQIGSAAVPARSVVDLHAAHIGRPVVLMFEDADPTRPIVVGVLQGEHQVPEGAAPGQVEVESDGERVIVSAKNELVLRCGKASITLTRDGKVLLRGTALSTHASGVNRIKGGSVQIN
jgi:hypothetical protein